MPEMPTAVVDSADRRQPRRSATATKRQRAQRHTVESGTDGGGHYQAVSVTLPTPQHQHSRPAPPATDRRAPSFGRPCDRSAVADATPLPRPVATAAGQRLHATELRRRRRGRRRCVRAFRAAAAARTETLVALTLAESRAHCNRLYLLCGKYESNAIALHQALCCSLHAYDVMLALLESRLAIVESANGADSGTATSTASRGADTAGAIGGSSYSTQALESRRAAEAVAQHLLTRLARPEVSGTGAGDSPSGGGPV